MDTTKAMRRLVVNTLPPVVGSPNSDTPRVTNVLADMVEPLAKANSSEEFNAALKDALQRLIAEAKKLERENARQDKMLENAFVLACERSRRGYIDRELYAVLGISIDAKAGTSNIRGESLPPQGETK
jgi:hypothetical protein